MMKQDPNVHRRRVYKLRYPDGDFDAYDKATHCELCGVEFTKKGFTKKVQDHDHNTIKTRGVICASCNRQLVFVEQIGIKKLSSYLEKGHDDVLFC